MFNPIELVMDAFVDKLEKAYTRNYGNLQESNATIIAWAARMSLEHFANSDALYHNMEHTIMVTLVGQEVLRGKHIREGGVSHRDWLNFIISLLCHDIGHIRGICRQDRNGNYATGTGNETVTLPSGATDAALSPYHVDRGKLFIREPLQQLLRQEIVHRMGQNGLSEIGSSTNQVPLVGPTYEGIFDKRSTSWDTRGARALACAPSNSAPTCSTPTSAPRRWSTCARPTRSSMTS
jgi:hypothetical protein